MKHIHITLLAVIAIATHVFAQENVNNSAFKQLKEKLPTPNAYRTASGAPGEDYFQQKADYDIEVSLNDKKQKIDGYEEITYHNNSPHKLKYLWLQLDQNIRKESSLKDLTSTHHIKNKMSFDKLEKLIKDFNGGFNIEYVKDKRDNPLPYTINETMMRIDLKEPLEPGDSYTFQVKWWYNINNRLKDWGRSGYEYFEEDDNYLYTIAQFYPRMCVYNDVEGWQNKQFLGRGEFALEFGDYEVSITVPADHVVNATGTLQNRRSVLSDRQQERYEKARTADQPVMIINEEEARKNEQSKVYDKTKTWTYEAENVRDFAFVSSRKFIWDAMGVKAGDRTVMAESLYPKEGNPLWEQFSTRVVAHTLKTYSDFTFEYPYPKAVSVHTAMIGMEYPMICFNYGRPEEDDTYSERMKYGMISVIIHEVGHNFFPMIVNSDERQWTWMDEGLNSFLEYLTEQRWERDYPSRRGPAYKITDYMAADHEDQVPIMTNSESIKQFGNNAYGKPATALNILRETVMGRELFDDALKTYAQRWKFKHPSPADFFRTMEDASGVDLDWFWRGWFYTTDHVDIAIDAVNRYKIDTKNPEESLAFKKKRNKDKPEYISDMRNKTAFKTYVEQDTAAADFYTHYNEDAIDILDKKSYQKYLDELDSAEKEMLKTKKHFYEIKFSNKGGLVMPIILKFKLDNGEQELKRIPAQIWRHDNEEVEKVFVTDHKITQIELDPYLETADTDRNNNFWPAKDVPSRFELYKRKRRQSENKMQRARKIKELKQKAQDKEESEENEDE